MNAFWIGKVNSRRGPAELSYIRPQELIQEVLEMNQFLDSGFAQPLEQTSEASHAVIKPTTQRFKRRSDHRDHGPKLFRAVTDFTSKNM